MKGIKTLVVALCASLILSSCGMSNTAKGSLIGAAAGGAAGTGIGTLIGHLAGGKSGAKKGAAIGAAVGVAAGTTAGALIGRKMDKAKKAAEALNGAQAELLEDGMGVRVTFESGLLFTSSSASLSGSALNSLAQFATSVVTPDMDLAVVGHTDNDAWRGCTPAQSEAKNQALSEQRANAVSNYLKTKGVTASQIKTVLGQGQTNPVADNTTAAGKAQNRRVEVYIIPSEKMVAEAEAGTLK